MDPVMASMEEEKPVAEGMEEKNGENGQLERQPELLSRGCAITHGILRRATINPLVFGGCILVPLENETLSFHFLMINNDLAVACHKLSHCVTSTI